MWPEHPAPCSPVWNAPQRQPAPGVRTSVLNGNLTIHHIPTLTSHQNFFSQRIVYEWNKLPQVVIEATLVNGFKNKLDRHWKDMGAYSWTAKQLIINKYKYKYYHTLSGNQCNTHIQRLLFNPSYVSANKCLRVNRWVMVLCSALPPAWGSPSTCISCVLGFSLCRITSASTSNCDTDTAAEWRLCSHSIWLYPSSWTTGLLIIITTTYFPHLISRSCSILEPTCVFKILCWEGR